jgi:hypothetical protein
MKSAIDWRGHYDSYPYVALGAALGAGLLLGALLAESRSESRSESKPGRSSEVRWHPRLAGRPVSEPQQILRKWINIAAATYRVAETLYRVVPTLRDEFAGLRRSGRSRLFG